MNASSEMLGVPSHAAFVARFSPRRLSLDSLLSGFFVFFFRARRAPEPSSFLIAS